MEIPRAYFLRLLAFVALMTTALWAADPTLGTWKLNVRKSRFMPGPAFQSETRTLRRAKGRGPSDHPDDRWQGQAG